MTSLSWRYLRKQKKRTVLTILGVLLATALVSSVGLFLTSFQNMGMTEAEYNAGSHDFKIVCYGEDARHGLTAEEIQKLRDNALTARVGAAVTDEMLRVPGAAEDSYTDIKLYQRDADGFSLKKYEMLEGRMPQNSSEIALTVRAVESLGRRIQMGDRLEGDIGWSDTVLNEETALYEDVFTPVGQTGDFTVVGIINDYDDTGVTWLQEGYDHHYAAYVKMAPRLDLDSAVAKLLSAANIEASAEKNGDYLQYLGQGPAEEMQRGVNITFLLLAFIILTAMVVVIRNSFAMSVAEKMSQFGTLRCIGASPAQIRRLVFSEAIIIWAIAIPLGLLLGLAAMAVVFAVVQKIELNMLRYLRLVVSAWPFAATAALSFVAVLFSAISPARKASRITAIEAVRGSSVLRGEEQSRRSHGRLTGALFGYIGLLAAKNIRRNRKRYRTTILSVILSITLFICLGGFARTVQNAAYNWGDVEGTDFIVRGTAASMEEEALYAETQKQMEQVRAAVEQSGFAENTALTGVQQVTLMTPRSRLTDDYLNKMLPAGGVALNTSNEWYEEIGTEEVLIQTTYIYLIDEEIFEQLTVGAGVTSYSELVASGGVVYCPNIVYSGKNFGLINADLSDHQVGDRVYAEQGYDAPEQENLREYRLLSLEVAALTHDMPWFVTERAAPAILLPVESRARLEADGVGDNIWLQLNVKAYDDKMDQLSALLEKEAGPLSGRSNVDYYDIYASVRENRNLALVAGIFLYGFMTVVILICSLNLFNTINTNLQLRKREIAMLRAVGMSNRQMWRMLLLECVLYGVVGTLFGTAVGLFLQKLLISAFSIGIAAEMVDPLFYILASFLGAVLIGLLGGVGPIRRLIREPIVEEIRAQD